MAISELDMATIRVLYLARVVHGSPTSENLDKLGTALKNFDDKYATERLLKQAPARTPKRTP